MLAGLGQDGLRLELELPFGELQIDERRNGVQTGLELLGVLHVVLEDALVTIDGSLGDDRRVPARLDGEEIGTHLSEETAGFQRDAQIDLGDQAVFVVIGAFPIRAGGKELHRIDDAACPGELAYRPVGHDLWAPVERIERGARLQVGDVRHVRPHRVPGLAHVDEQVAQLQVVPEHADVRLTQPEGRDGAVHAVEVGFHRAAHFQFADPVAGDVQSQARGQSQHPERRDLGEIPAVLGQAAVLGHVEEQVLRAGVHLMGVEHRIVANEAVQTVMRRFLFLSGSYASDEGGQDGEKKGIVSLFHT